MKKSVTSNSCLELNSIFVANCLRELTYEKYLQVSLALQIVICEYIAIMSACDGH